MLVMVVVVGVAKIVVTQHVKEAVGKPVEADVNVLMNK